MLRQRLVRQSALNVSTCSDNTMPSPPPLRRRRNSHDAKMYRQLSSDSLDKLLASPASSGEQRGRGRRHSVACGTLYLDVQKPTFKSAFSSAVRRMSDACAMLSSAPSSTYNLSPHPPAVPPRKKEEKVILPQVLGTFRQNHQPVPHLSNADKKKLKNSFEVNRRFSTDCPPPTYSEAITGWKQPVPRQKLCRQHEVVSSKASLVAVEDDDGGNQEE